MFAAATYVSAVIRFCCFIFRYADIDFAAFATSLITLFFALRFRHCHLPYAAYDADFDV